MVVFPRFLLAAPLERHLCMERPHCMHLRPSLHAVQGIYTYTAARGHLGALWDWPGFLWAASLHGPQRCICAPHGITAPGLNPALRLLTHGSCALRWISGPGALALNLLLRTAPSLHSTFVPLSAPASTPTLLLGTVSSLYSGLGFRTQQFLLHCTTSFSSLCLWAVLYTYSGHVTSVRIFGVPAMCLALC